MKRRWVTTRTGRCLHLVDPADAWPWGGDFRRSVRVADGRELLAEIPSVVARLAAPRCRGCCRAAGVPEGSGAWIGSAITVRPESDTSTSDPLVITCV